MFFARPIGPLALLAGLSGLPTLAGLAGCTAYAEPPVVGGSAAVYADAVPPDIYAYPHVWYEGGYAYLVGDRWYYPHGRRWVVLRSEPTELYSYRRSYAERRGPVVGRAVRQGPDVRVAPPTPPREEMRIERR